MKTPQTVLLLLVALLVAAAADARAQQVVLLSGAFGGGGAEISNAQYRMNGTLGQTFADVALGPRTVHGAGFWFVSAGTVIPVANESDPDVGAEIPDRFQLEQNYPNPFNPTTNIRFGLPEASQVEVTVYNVLGRRVRVLVDREMPAGWHTVAWDGRSEQGAPAPSGLYLYQMRSRDYSATRKMMLVK